MKNQSGTQHVILGVDTHLDVHLGAVISHSGSLLGTRSVSVSLHGYEDLFHWATQFGQLEVAGIEGTGTYGAALCRYLQSKGIIVIEVNRPDRSKRRMHGKSDPMDTENAARVVLAETATAIPKDKTGACEAIRMVLVARRSAVKAKSQAMNQIRALLVSAPQEIRERLWRAKPQECAKACLSVRSLGTTELSMTLMTTLKLLARRWTILAAELSKLDKSLDGLTQKHCKNLRSRMGSDHIQLLR